MKKILKLGAVLTVIGVLALAFTGCTDDPKPPPPPPPPPPPTNYVTGVTLYWAYSGETEIYGAQPEGFNPTDVVKFWAVVTAGSTLVSTDYTLTFEAETGSDLNTLLDGGPIRIQNGGREITIAASASGAFKVTAASSANGQNGSPVTVVWSNIEVGSGSYTLPPEITDPNVTIPEVIPELNFDDAEWIIRNTAIARGVSLNASTTTTATLAANDDRRYVVFNNEPGALIDQAPALADIPEGVLTAPDHFKDVTIMYLNKAFEEDVNATVWGAYGLEARVRIAGWRDGGVFGSTAGEAVGSVRQGVIIGMIEDPEAINLTFNGTGPEALATNPQNAPAFVGQRIAATGQHRGYVKRSNNNGEYGSTTITAGGINIPGTSISFVAQFGIDDILSGNIVNREKKEGFADQEYVYRVMRSGPTTYTITILDATGTTQIQSYNSVSGTNNLHPNLVGDRPMYLAFLVYGVKAEISDIKVFYKGAEAWVDSAVANATPLPPKVRRVDILSSVDKPGSASGEKLTDADGWVNLGDRLPAVVTLTPEIIPLTTNPKTIVWSTDPSEESGSASVIVEAGSVARNGSSAYGETDVIATPVVPGAVGRFKFNLIDPANIPPPTNVVIGALSRDTLYFGNNRKSSVTLTAVVEPALAMQDVVWAITEGSSAATINSVTGVLTPKGVNSDTEVKVTATASKDEVVVVSDAVTITVKADDGKRAWTFGKDDMDVTIPVPSPWINEGGAANTATVTLDGGLSLTPSGLGTSGGNINWRGTQNMGAGTLGYVGCLQPSSYGKIGEIQDFGETVKVSIVITHTGDTTVNRVAYIQFGSDPKVNKVIPGQYDNGATTLENATIIAYGTGVASFGVEADGGARIWEITVEPAAAPDPLSALEVNPTAVSVDVGASIPAVTVIRTPADAIDAIVWSSANPTIAAVNSNTGVITGVSEGNATITVSKVGDSSISASVTVTVNAVPLTGLSVLPTSVSLEVGQSLPGSTVKVTRVPPAATDAIEWVSANTSIATVNAVTGMITGIAQGSTMVRVQKVGDATIGADVAVQVDLASPPSSKIIWQWKIGDVAPTATAQTINGKTVTGSAAITIANNHATAPDGAIILNANRLAIGLPASPTYNNGLTAITAANGAYVTNGELDLDEPFKVTVKGSLMDAGTTLSLVLNNWANSNLGGVLMGAANQVPDDGGRIALQVLGTKLNAADVFIYNASTVLKVKDGSGDSSSAATTLSPPVVLEDVIHNQFLQFRASGGTGGWIEEIIIEYVNDHGAPPVYEDVFWNFSNASQNWPWQNDTAQGYNYYGDDGSLNGLTFVGVAKWGLQEAPGPAKYTCGGETFSHRIGANGSGSTSNRALKFTVGGDCTVKLYMQSGGAGRNVTLWNLTTGTEIGTVTVADDPAPEFAYNGGVAELCVYNSANNNFYGIKVTYDD